MVPMDHRPQNSYSPAQSRDLRCGKPAQTAPFAATKPQQPIPPQSRTQACNAQSLATPIQLSHPRRPAHVAAKITPPATHAPMCAYSKGKRLRGAPVTASATPSTPPAAINSHPSSLRKILTGNFSPQKGKCQHQKSSARQQMQQHRPFVNQRRVRPSKKISRAEEQKIKKE